MAFDPKSPATGKRLSEMSADEWKANDEYVRQTVAGQAEAATSAARGDLQMPPRVLGLVSGELEETPALWAVRDAKPGIVCLSGGPGVGKTIAAGRWLWERGRGRFMKSARLARVNRYDRDEMRQLLAQPALVLDDLGTEFVDNKGNFHAIVDELIDYRYDYGLPLVITTNLSGVDFKARYEERIADRIRESGRFVEIAGDSMRRRP